MRIVGVVEDLLSRVEKTEALDRVGEPVSNAIRAVPRPVKDVLNGTWLGHPAHPMLTDIPIGAWTSAFFLDLFGGSSTRRAARALVGVGTLAALPTAAAGWADWVDIAKRDRRIGLVHAAANVGAVTIYGLSYLARRRGAQGRGVVLGFMGAAVASFGGHVGGHLSFRRGANVSRNAWEQGSSEWVAVLDEGDLAEGVPAVGKAGDVDVLVVRRGSRLHALGDVCSHAGGPLHEGSLEDGCVVCPWHGSTFELSDGSVVHGPAAAPQPAYDAKVDGGRVWVRSRS